MSLHCRAVLVAMAALGCEGSLVGGSSGDNGDPGGNGGGADASSLDPDAARRPNLSLESLRNTNPIFTRYQDKTQAEITALGFANNDFSEPTAGNGFPAPQGQFRLWCQWSHFAYDDPIVLPRNPGASHLHMFWGNTNVDAYTVHSEDPGPDVLMERGGGSCFGFELNRSSYWMPAMLTSATGPRKVVIPEGILLYYKSYVPSKVNPLPAGLEMLAGNVSAGAVVGEDFDQGFRLNWNCGPNGHAYNYQSRIPTNCAQGERLISASIQFPQCLAEHSPGVPN